VNHLGSLMDGPSLVLAIGRVLIVRVRILKKHAKHDSMRELQKDLNYKYLNYYYLLMGNNDYHL